MINRVDDKNDIDAGELDAACIIESLVGGPSDDTKMYLGRSLVKLINSRAESVARRVMAETKTGWDTGLHYGIQEGQGISAAVRPSKPETSPAPQSDAVEALIEAAQEAQDALRRAGVSNMIPEKIDSRAISASLLSAIAAVRAASPWRDVNSDSLPKYITEDIWVCCRDGVVRLALIGNYSGSYDATHWMPCSKPIPPLPKENNHAE